MGMKTGEKRAAGRLLRQQAVWTSVCSPTQDIRALRVFWPQGDRRVGRDPELRAGPVAMPREGFCP